MKRSLSLLFALIVIVTIAIGQTKERPKQSNWVKSGGGSFGDTTTESYTLMGKDSISVSIEIDSCGHFLKWIDYDGKLHDCKNMVRKYLEANMWSWDKEYTITKNKKWLSEKPHWVNNSGIGDSYHGVYTQNGKFIQPEYIIDKYGKHKVD